MRTSGRKCSHCTKEKNHFARPLQESFRLNIEVGQSGVTLQSVFCTGSPKSGARPVIISKISSLKLSPGRLWRLGGFQRLDTSSVFWPRNSLGDASFVLPAFCARKSKGAAQRNPYQAKIVERLERENITRRCTKTKSDKSRERRQNEDCMWWLRNLKTRAMNRI